MGASEFSNKFLIILKLIFIQSMKGHRDTIGKKNFDDLNEHQKKFYTACEIDTRNQRRSSSIVPPSPRPSTSSTGSFNMNSKYFEHEVDNFSDGGLSSSTPTTPSTSVDEQASSGSANVQLITGKLKANLSSY